MTHPSHPRAPRSFRVDDPALEIEPEAAAAHTVDDAADLSSVGSSVRAGEPMTVRRGLRWGAVLFSAMAALAMLAAGVWFARFVSAAIADPGWVGWTATALLATAGVAAAVIVLREVIGLMRLARLGRLRHDAEAALREKDVKLERAVARDIARLFGGRPDVSWGLARFREHQGDVRDAGELLALAEREILAPLDGEARRLVLASAKRVATVTALSPIALITVGMVLVESVGLIRRVATLYGGRPGLVGALKLGRMVIAHLVAASGIALTDDLLGQFLGQDLIRRLSRRLGEGAFNGALTARIGAAAVEITRPLPYLEAPRVRARDILAELFRRDNKAAGRQLSD